MIRNAKKLIRKTLNVLNIDIHRIPEHEKNKFAWLSDLHINTIIDIGANAGQFALKIKKYFPDTLIYSFEPLHDIYMQLIKKTNKLRNFEAYNVALGEFNGTSKIHRSIFSPSSSMLNMADLHKKAYPFTAESYIEEIMVRTLDDLVTDQGFDLTPDILIKIDVQGLEDKVIKGGLNTFKKAKAVISEISFYELYEGQPLFDDIYYMLRELGFRCNGVFDTVYHPKTGMPLFADASFLKITE